MKKLKLAALILGTVMLLSSCNSPKNTTERTKSSEVKTEAPVENETTFGFNPYTGETITNEKNSDNSTDEKKEPEYPITIYADDRFDGGVFYGDYAFYKTKQKLTIIDRKGKVFNEIELENNSWGTCKRLKASAISFIGVIYEKRTIEVILTINLANNSSAKIIPSNVMFIPKGNEYIT